MPDLWRLSIERHADGGTAVLVVAGRLSAAHAPALGAAITAELAVPGRRVLLDLSGVDYISSAGLRVLAAAAADAGRSDRRLVLCGLTDPVRLALDLAGMQDDFGILSTRAEALERLASSAAGASDRDTP